MEVATHKILPLILDLLVDINTQVAAIKDVMASEYCQSNEQFERLGREFSAAYDKRREQMMQKLSAYYAANT